MKLASDPEMMVRAALLTQAAWPGDEKLYGNNALDLLGFNELATLRLNFGISGGVAHTTEDELQVLFEPIRRDFPWWKLWRWPGYWRAKQKRTKRRAVLHAALRDQVLEALQRTPGVEVWGPVTQEVML